MFWNVGSEKEVGVVEQACLKIYLEIKTQVIDGI